MVCNRGYDSTSYFYFCFVLSICIPFIMAQVKFRDGICMENCKVAVRTNEAGTQQIRHYREWTSSVLQKGLSRMYCVYLILHRKATLNLHCLAKVTISVCKSTQNTPVHILIKPKVREIFSKKLENLVLERANCHFGGLNSVPCPASELLAVVGKLCTSPFTGGHWLCFSQIWAPSSKYLRSEF